MFLSFSDELRKIAAARLQGKIEFQGLPVSIENRRGSYRRGVDSEGNPWKTLMQAHYGYIRKSRTVRATGGDGEPIDVFVGPESESDIVVGVTLLKDSGKVDETKYFVGYRSPKDAVESFKDHYPTKWETLMGPHRVMTMDKFRTLLAKDQKI
ncbi:MAG: hypothetical protein KDB07_06575 [Planctomycetes bacterium]|nr:hypothetical protein [Planctomycetota bacterium]